MNNREVSHIWANGQKASGKGSNFYFEGDTIYSYGRHFPCAKRVVMLNGDVVYLINPARYSVSTSKHQSLVRCAIAGDARKFYIDPKVSNWDNLDNIPAMQDAQEKQHAADIRSGEEEKARKREDAKRRREQTKAAKASLDNFPDDLKAWKRGGAMPPALRNGQLNATYLRLNGDQIETTRGARVPASVCRKVWPILLAAHNAEVKATGEGKGSPAWNPFFSRPDFHWGNYVGVSMRRIAKGSPISVKVGCHEFDFSEVVDMARELNLF